jgi:DNA-binding NarL/FixJ family response regulator
MFFVVQGGFKAALSPSRIQADKIELMLSGATATRNRASAGVAVDKAPERVRDDSPYLDRVSKQCLLLARQYKLSARETEVAEAMARGDTIPGVAATLGLSENTVRTHIKRIYAKVDVHKKQELLDLIRSFDPAALVDNDPDRFHPKS